MTTLLGAKDLAKLLGISLRKLEQMIERGETPSHIKLGRTRKWRNHDVQNWLNSMFNQKDKVDGPTNPS